MGSNTHHSTFSDAIADWVRDACATVEQRINEAVSEKVAEPDLKAAGSWIGDQTAEPDVDCCAQAPADDDDDFWADLFAADNFDGDARDDEYIVNATFITTCPADALDYLTDNTTSIGEFSATLI